MKVKYQKFRVEKWAKILGNWLGKLPENMIFPEIFRLASLNNVMSLWEINSTQESNFESLRNKHTPHHSVYHSEYGGQKQKYFVKCNDILFLSVVYSLSIRKVDTLNANGRNLHLEDFYQRRVRGYDK